MTVDESVQGGVATEQEHLGEQSPEEAEASFAAGFNAVAKVETEPQKPVATKVTEKDEAPASAGNADGLEVLGDPYGGMTPEQVKAQQVRMRRMEGQLGDLKSKYAALNALVKPTVEQQEEQKVLLKNVEGMEKSLAEFQELLPFKDELEHITQEFADLRRQVGSGINPAVIQEQVKQAVGQGIMDYVVPDWSEISASKEFRQFMLTGGPSEEAYREYAIALNNPSGGENPDSYVDAWKDEYPEWWNDKGQKLFSDNPTDSINVLERFQQAKQGQQERQQVRQQSERQRANRLRSSATPVGVGGDPTLGLSNDEAFNAGFRKAYKK